MSWKPGQKAYVTVNDPHWHPTNRIGDTVRVLAVHCGGFASIKVKSLNTDDVFYVRPSWIQKPTKPMDPHKAKAIRKEAERMAEERMKRLMEEAAEKEKLAEKLESEKKKKPGPKPKNTPAHSTDLPDFADIRDQFYALFAVKENLNGSDENIQTVLSLAEYAIFEKIKGGCTWSQET